MTTRISPDLPEEEIEEPLAEDHEEEEEEQNITQTSSHAWPAVLLTVVAIIVGTVVLFLMVSSAKEDEVLAEKKEIAVATTTAKVVKVGKEKVLYRFSNSRDGVIRITLKSDADFYPKGGAVKITPPSGKWWIDEPGTAIVRPKEHPGEFVLEIPDSSKAWGIEVWN